MEWVSSIEIQCINSLRITAQNQLIGRDMYMYMYVQAKRSFNAQGYKFVRYFNNMHSLPGQRFLSDTFPQCLKIYINGALLLH